MLSPDDFWTAGKLTQYVSIDLIVKHQNKFMFGLRNNEPAKGTLFVPGSKTFKGNKLTDEITRITKYELGTALEPSRAAFVGVFDHIYDRNFRDTSYGVHYVCIALEITASKEEAEKFSAHASSDQHSHIQWLTLEEIIKSDCVHPNSSAYFKRDITNCLYRQINYT